MLAHRHGLDVARGRGRESVPAARGHARPDGPRRDPEGGAMSELKAGAGAEETGPGAERLRIGRHFTLYAS